MSMNYPYQSGNSLPAPSEALSHQPITTDLAGVPQAVRALYPGISKANMYDLMVAVDETEWDQGCTVGNFEVKVNRVLTFEGPTGLVLRVTEDTFTLYPGHDVSLMAQCLLAVLYSHGTEF